MVKELLVIFFVVALTWHSSSSFPIALDITSPGRQRWFKYRHINKPDINLRSSSVSNDIYSNPSFARFQPERIHLSPSAPFFRRLGLANSDGTPKNKKRLKQCFKFVAIAGDIIDKALDTYTDGTKLRIVDMGCGEAYQTFSLHSYLCNKYRQSSKVFNVIKTQGIDRKGPILNSRDTLARDLQGDFNSLSFAGGEIGEKNNTLFDVEHYYYSDRSTVLDVLVALNVCDTATDDAIWFGITRKVDIIFLAPCCQQQLKAQIDKHYAAFLSKQHNSLSEALRNDDTRWLHAQMLTDVMRVLLLEIAGYDVELIPEGDCIANAEKFVITAVKRNDDNDENRLIDLESKLKSIAMMYGIMEHRLATLMGIQFDTSKRKGIMTSSNMPPL